MLNTFISTQDLLNLLPEYGLSRVAEDYVRKTLFSEPSREVGEYARKSVAGAFASPSQGITIQYESHTAELAWLFRWEFDPKVLGFRDQPPMVTLRKADKNGVLRNSVYTPDFLVFREDEVVVVEVKTAREVVKLSEKYPDQWKFDGNWHYLPAQDAFQEKGLKHIVCCLNEGRSIETHNYKTLIHAGRRAIAVVPQISESLVSALESVAWMSLTALKMKVPDASYSDIYQLVSRQQLFVDLKNQLLTDPDSCFVTANPEMLKIRSENDWSVPKILSSVDVLSVPSAGELLRAMKRLERVESCDQSRHTRRLRKRVADGAANGLTPLQSLISRRKGNSRAKLPPIVRDVLLDHIRTFYMSAKRPKLHAAWTDYRVAALVKHPDYQPVVIKTYRRFVDSMDSETVALTRGGKRAGNAASDTTAVLDRAIIATRPFERASIDHTKLKIRALVVESGGVTYSKKPWMSALIDEATGYWLSFALSFRDPSKRSLSTLYRHCAREYGKLPEHVHSDRGSDLRSVYYRGLLAHYGITVDWSPSGHSRFNSLVERLNKQLKDQWISRRAGNTVDYIETRKYSKGHRPEDLAELSLQDLFNEIEVYRQLYNQTVLGSEAASPAYRFQQGLEKFDFSGVSIKINDEFLLVTAYDTDHQFYKISPGGDLVFNCLHYHHPELRRLRPKRSHTELRVDPEDPYRVYCLIDGKWETALNSGHQKFMAKSTVERQAESFRVAEGRSLRDMAKQNGNDEKARAMTTFDESYHERTVDERIVKTSQIVKKESDISLESTDLFERLKLKSLRDLESEKL